MSFEIFGVKFKISVVFAVITAFLLVTDKTGLMSASLIAVLVHETGHLIAMKAAKCAPGSVELCAGGILITGNAACTAKDSLLIALSGPVANFLCFALLFCAAKLGDGVTVYAFSAVQLLVGAVNILPIKGLDGGSVLKIILSHFRKCNAALILKAVSFFTAAAITVIGTAVAVKNVSNPSLLLLGIYLIIINILKS